MSGLRDPLTMTNAEWEREGIRLAAGVINSGETYCARHGFGCECSPMNLSPYLYRARTLLGLDTRPRP